MDEGNHWDTYTFNVGATELRRCCHGAKCAVEERKSVDRQRVQLRNNANYAKEYQAANGIINIQNLRKFELYNYQ